MTKDEALKMAIEAMNSAYSSHGKILTSNPAQDAWLYHGCDAKLFKALQACKEALEQPVIELNPANIAKARDEIYYAWRKYWAWGIPSKDGEAVFNANGDGFLAGWLACEQALKEKNS
jgi:hypothetical protein